MKAQEIPGAQRGKQDSSCIQSTIEDNGCLWCSISSWYHREATDLVKPTCLIGGRVENKSESKIGYPTSTFLFYLTQTPQAVEQRNMLTDSGHKIEQDVSGRNLAYLNKRELFLFWSNSLLILIFLSFLLLGTWK